MSPKVHLIHAWLLTLLLLSSTTMSSRACVGCEDGPAPASAATQDDAHACCPGERPETPADEQDSTPHQDCDCPLGCCPTATLKAMSGPSGVPAATHAAEHWDIATSRPRAGPSADGPRRPPRL